MATKNASSSRKAAASAPASSKPAGRLRAKSGEAAAEHTEALTIIYVHGIGNKPIASVLKCQWDNALMGFDLGERSRLAYWVNREFYPEPSNEECRDGDLSPKANSDMSGNHVSKRLQAESLEDMVDDIASNEKSRALLTRLSISLEAGAQVQETRQAKLSAKEVGAKVLPLPSFLRQWITRQVTRAFLKDVNDFLFVPARRAAMRESLLARLRVGGGPFVVIGHSQGSMIAYDVLSQLDPAKFDVRLFVTVGSPLGIQEVQDQLKPLTGQKRLAVPECVRKWVNAADLLDPVALDKAIGNDYAKSSRGVVVEDNTVSNPDSPQHPHSGSGYLRTKVVRAAVNDAVDIAAFQPVSPFIIARDASRVLEASPSGSRHELLIELAALEESKLSKTSDLHDQVVASLRKCAPGASDAELNLEVLKRYVSVSLTREEAERVADVLGAPQLAKRIRHVWLDAKKSALLDQSIQTIQAAPAHSAYAALGKGIQWAVLDSGINGAHPHFEGGVIAAHYDCTRRGAPMKLAVGANSDEHGHGTHVSGIIAGQAQRKNKKGEQITLSGMAPKAKLHMYRVLDRDGSGKDSWIIKALDHIAEINDQAGELVIHGVNLSLGGPFDQSSFGCGHTPLCSELRRLWNQGVLVVLAAGNEGFVRLVSDAGEIDANMDLSIGDPANLEEAIAVGSVHKAKPHIYGISYFSSRGPTADGRQKPDVVAPGERILSCRHKPLGAANTVESLYLEMSGTSMAAPHVSGVLAAFLGARREFIGYPDRVKEILVANCTDLRRDHSHQGAGLPNLVRMLVAT
jgi:subtilisin family serine protease